MKKLAKKNRPVFDTVEAFAAVCGLCANCQCNCSAWGAPTVLATSNWDVPVTSGRPRASMTA